MKCSFDVLKNYGLTPLEELYGLTNILINHDQGLCESLDLQEVSTFNVKKYMWGDFPSLYSRFYKVIVLGSTNATNDEKNTNVILDVRLRL